MSRLNRLTAANAKKTGFVQSRSKDDIWYTRKNVYLEIPARFYDLRGLDREEIIRWLCRKPAAPGMQKNICPLCQAKHGKAEGAPPSAASRPDSFPDALAGFVSPVPSSFCEAALLHESQKEQVELLLRVNPLMLVIITEETGFLTGPKCLSQSVCHQSPSQSRSQSPYGCRGGRIGGDGS